MANIKSAEKRARQDQRRRLRNRTHRSRMRRAIRNLRTTIEAGDAPRAQEMLPQTLSIIDRTAQRGSVHRNLAARTKSRLIRAVRKLAG